MNLFLQHPALLGLLALAAVPLLVHLLSRAKPPNYHFSNIEFLRKVLRLTSRLRKPKDWLLLALRTLALLAFAAAFLGPLLLSDSAPLPGEKRTVVCLIDRSGSMAASDGATSRFGTACAEAAALLESARPELANLVWIDARPDAAFPEPGPNRDFLADELSRAGVRPEPNAIEAAFELAARQFPQAEGRRELHVFSDFQASTWKDVDPLIPENIDLHLVPIASTTVPNVSVASLVPVPASPVAGRELLVQCRIDNHSGEARRVSLTLDAGGSRQSQPLDLPPGGAAEATFSVRCGAAGLLPLTAEIDGDAFTPDDQRHAVVRVRESLCLAITGDAGSAAARPLLRAAAALPWLDVLTGVDPGNPPACDILAIPEWTGTEAEQIRAVAANATMVLVFPTDATGSAIETLFNPSATSSEGSRLALQSDDAGWEASPVAEHPAFALFAGGEFGNPLGGRFRQRLRLPEIGNAEVIARYSDSVPALLAAKDAPLVLANLPLDPAHTTWTDRPEFLPALAELILHFGPATAGESFINEPGEPISWTTDDAAGQPVLEAPDGSSVPLVSSVSGDGTVWQTESAPGTGLFRWTVSGQPVHYTAVNFPESESDLAPLPEPPTFGTGESRADGARLAALDEGLPLWPWLLAAALLFLLTESLVASLTPKPATP